MFILFNCLLKINYFLRGGVLPPGAAFAKTSMIEQLNNNGVKFEIIKVTE